MSKCRVILKRRCRWFLLVFLGMAGLSPLCCRAQKDVAKFYLRSCETGRLIGPIHLTPGHTLPPLNEQAYAIANPAESELAIRQLLLATSLYESHHFDCEVEEVFETIRQMLKHRIGDKAPALLVDDIAAPITMDIGDKEPAYEALFNIAAKAKARVFIEDGAVVLSRKKLTELTSLDATTSEVAATTGERPSR